MTKPVQARAGQQAVGREGLVPFGEVQVAGDDGGGLLVALGDQVVQVLVGRCAQRLESEVVDDQERHLGQRGQLAFVAAGGPGGVQALGQAGAGGERE